MVRPEGGAWGDLLPYAKLSATPENGQADAGKKAKRPTQRPEKAEKQERGVFRGVPAKAKLSATPELVQTGDLRKAERPSQRPEKAEILNFTALHWQT